MLLSRDQLPPDNAEGAVESDQELIVIGITGASGAPIALKVLETLKSLGHPTAVVASEGGRTVVEYETSKTETDLRRLARDWYSDRDFSAPIASGTRKTRGMAVVPCSGSTAAKIALGLADTLITRAAQVHLKERRPLVVVPRETPLSVPLLRNLTTLAELGVAVVDASPPYSTRPKTVQDQVDFVAGRVLDQFGIDHTLYHGWKEGER
jgi:4-hydroxy-3-polyprenylbenzoate decarboxylase